MIDWLIVWDRCICTNSYISLYFSNFFLDFWLGYIAWRIRRSGRVGWIQFHTLAEGLLFALGKWKFLL
jgi:hypothetical protein